jgi:hypothetical protein
VVIDVTAAGLLVAHHILEILSRLSDVVVVG